MSVTMTSGEAAVSKDLHVECADQVSFNGHTYTYGCEFHGTVNVVGDRETRETWWECPSCGLDHYGLIEDFR